MLDQATKFTDDPFQRRLDAVVGMLRGWAWETDAQHRFTYMSESVRLFTGRAPEWHYGKTRFELGNFCLENAEHRRFLAQLDAREAFGPVDFVRKQYGQELWMRAIGKPQFDANDRFKGYIGVAFDVTAEVLAVRERRRQDARRSIARVGEIDARNGADIVYCVVTEISQSGARLVVPAQLSVPTTFRLNISTEHFVRDCRLIWRLKDQVGVEFLRPDACTP